MNKDFGDLGLYGGGILQQVQAPILIDYDIAVDCKVDKDGHVGIFHQAVSGSQDDIRVTIV